MQCIRSGSTNARGSFYPNYKLTKDLNIVERFAVGQNVATTWTLDREPPTRHLPEFARHINAWFEEVRTVFNEYKCLENASIFSRHTVDLVFAGGRGSSQMVGLLLD